MRQHSSATAKTTSKNSSVSSSIQYMIQPPLNGEKLWNVVIEFNDPQNCVYTVRLVSPLCRLLIFTKLLFAFWIFSRTSQYPSLIHTHDTHRHTHSLHHEVKSLSKCGDRRTMDKPSWICQFGFVKSAVRQTDAFQRCRTNNTNAQVHMLHMHTPSAQSHCLAVEGKSLAPNSKGFSLFHAPTECLTICIPCEK